MITCTKNETEAGHLAHMLAELDRRELGALLAEWGVRGDPAGTVAMLEGRMDM